jgi:hypothetical protein
MLGTWFGSADGDFADTAAQLASAGVHVIGALGRGRLSRKLQFAVREMVRLPIDWNPLDTAVAAAACVVGEQRSA